MRNANNTITYTPDPNYNGPDSFTYQACDPAGLCDSATVSITVTPVNDRPDARDDSANTVRNTAVVIDVLANDVDPDGDTLNVRSFTQPANGTVTRSGNSLRYRPRNNFVGADSFTYTACDRQSGGLCDTATVRITVTAANREPNARDDDACTKKNRPVTINVLANDSDPDGNPLTVTVTQQPANGSAVRNPDNTVTYTPNPNFVGADAFRYQACDAGGLCDTARVEVQVSRRSDCRNEDDDDHDDDGEDDDEDEDDDNDGEDDEEDEDDDNDGEDDEEDEDDDNDGIHDDFDDESSQQTQSSRADEAEAGGVVTYQVTADVNTLLLAVVVEGPGSFVIEIYNPQGLRVAQGVSVGGRAVAVAPTLGPGNYTVKVWNTGPAATGFSSTGILSRNWPALP